MSRRLILSLTTILGLGLGALPSLSAPQFERDCLDAQCLKQSLWDLKGFTAVTSGEKAGSTRSSSYGTWGFDLKGMDRTIAPGNDFYSYAVGTKIKTTKIPADKVGVGSFDTLADLSDNRLKALIEALVVKKTLTPDEAKIATLYKDVLNQKLKDKLDLAPVAGRLKAIEAIKDHSEMAHYMGQSAGFFGASSFGVYVNDDAKDPTHYVVYLTQAGLSLPDRDYYLEDGFKDKKVKYQAYVATMLKMAGQSDPEAKAKAIVALETEVAQNSWTRVEQRDDIKSYNPMSLADLPAYAPGFDWDAFAKGAGIAKAKKIIVSENTAIVKLAQIYKATPIETLKAWQVFKTLDQAAPYLSQRFITARWTFWYHDLSGAEAIRPLWKRAIATTDGNLGELLGKSYVKAYFPESSKTKMVSLVADLKSALKLRIEGLGWMSATTKARALEKLSKFGVKIGYPDTWRDYSKLEIKPHDLVGNIERSSQFEWDYQVARIDQPIDRHEWGMTPQTVNAYYSATRNEIVFPAAILQPPFFDPKADMAVNYGGIGGVIGHEMTHGFDDSGRKYDGDGVLKDWWDAQDASKFEAATKALGAQYDAYEPVKGAKVQGALTMGENIADLGGILLALDAYRLSLNNKPAPVLDGFSGDQRVFLGWAQVWQSKYREDVIRESVVSDPHAPDQFRTIGPLRNVDDWYLAFKIKPTDAYYLKPEDRVKIW